MDCRFSGLEAETTSWLLIKKRKRLDFLALKPRVSMLISLLLELGTKGEAKGTNYTGT